MRLFSSRKFLLVTTLTLVFLAVSFLVLDLSSGIAAEAITRLRTPSGPRTILDQNFAALCAGDQWRRPMRLALEAPEFPTTPGRIINWTVAENRIRSLLRESAGARVGLYIHDLSGNKTLEINSRRRFASASLVKLPVVITMYQDLADGRLAPSAGLVFRESLRIGGSGVLKGEAAGVKVNLRDLCYLMLQHSDNTATNILSGTLGMSHVTAVCRDHGWRNTDMVRPVMALELRGRGLENWTTPREMGQMFEQMYQGRLISQEASNEMIRLMLNPPIDDRLPRYLPRDIDIVHKTGLIYDNAHDVGIVYLPNRQPILISAFVDGIGSNYRAAKMPIANIARILYEEATDPSYFQPGRRRN